MRRICLCRGEADLGAELDDQQVIEERHHAFDCGGEFRHEPVTGFRAQMCRAGSASGYASAPKAKVAGEEPHLVVAADAEVGLATLVECRVRPAARC